MRKGFCDNSQLGRFILDLPAGKLINDTSFWLARVAFSANAAAANGDVELPPSDASSSGFWNNPEGNPTPPDANSEYTSPWKRRGLSIKHTARQDSEPLNPSPSEVTHYTAPLQYKVRKTGYYCVGTLAEGSWQ